MTATEFLPIITNTTASIYTMLSNVEVFDGISMFSALIGLFALSIIVDVILWLRGVPISSETVNMQTTYRVRRR